MPPRLNQWIPPVVCLLAMEACGQQTTTLTAKAVYERVLPSVATLTATLPDGSISLGTGFLAVQDGIVVTAAHVVANATSIRARFASGEQVDVIGRVDVDAKADVALLAIPSSQRPLLALATATPNVGARIYTLGAPRALDFSISDGIVSQTRAAEGLRLIQFTAPASPGDSGGPLLNDDGNVVGVIDSQLENGQNLNFAIAIVHVMTLNPKVTVRQWTPAENSNQRSAIDLFNAAGEAEEASNFFKTVIGGMARYIDAEEGVASLKDSDDDVANIAGMLKVWRSAQQQWQATADQLAGFTSSRDSSVAIVATNLCDIYSGMANIYKRKVEMFEAAITDPRHAISDGESYLGNLQVEYEQLYLRLAGATGDAAKAVTDYSRGDAQGHTAYLKLTRVERDMVVAQLEPLAGPNPADASRDSTRSSIRVPAVVTWRWFQKSWRTLDEK